jgi:hypothetical protein
MPPPHRTPILLGHAPTQTAKAEAADAPLHAAAGAGDAGSLAAVLDALSLASPSSLTGALDAWDAMGATALHVAAAGEWKRERERGGTH